MTSATTISRALSTAIIQLERQNTSTHSNARLEAEILLAHCLMKSRTYLYAHSEASLKISEYQQFQQKIEQRIQGVPIAYLTEIREFWSLPLTVSSDTLIPRPETERLVELTLTLLADQPTATLLDLGTGSGAVALALASERPQWSITAADLSQEALLIAKQNAAQLRVHNIVFLHSDWFSALTEATQFNAIVSNPPYIAAHDPHLMQGDLRFEPHLALVSGEDGLTAINYIIKQSISRLKPNGLLLIEHGFDQHTKIETLLHDSGYKEIQCWQDWQGNNRVSGGRRID